MPSGDWRDEIPGRPESIRLLPLADEGHREAGWCVYAGELEGGPEVEVLCGGKNSKQASAAAIWRQGHLLHFGFQQDPSQLNDTGRDLLENCVRYIARFAADRPIGECASAFGGGVRPERAAWLLAVVGGEETTATALADRFFRGALAERVKAMADDAARAWARANVGALVPRAADGKLELSADLEALGLDVRASDFPERAAAVLAAGDAARVAAACRALARHVPGGPGAAPRATPAAAPQWVRYLADRRGQLFFWDAAGCVWLEDTLAVARGRRSAELVGSARAGR